MKTVQSYDVHNKSFCHASTSISYAYVLISVECVTLSLAKNKPRQNVPRKVELDFLPVFFLYLNRNPQVSEHNTTKITRALNELYSQWLT
jgi:hypothetical protein